jgi:hypothetical protein
MATCGPFVPFGVLSGAACAPAGASVASGGECDVACYAGFVSGGGKAKCAGGWLTFSGCVPGPSHRTIVLDGAPDSERGLNGAYEAEVPYTTPLKWKSKSGAVIVPSSDPDKLDLYMETDFKAAIFVSHAAGSTTLRVLDSGGSVMPGFTATFARPCADLRACLKVTPLDIAKCAAQAATCKPTVASGAKLEHGDKKVDLFTLGLAEEPALFGSDGRGVFVVSVSKDDAKKGKRLFVSAETNPSVVDVVDVEYDEKATTWREVKVKVKGTNLILIGSLIGGVALLIILSVVVYRVSRSPRFAPPFPPMPPM